MDTAELCAKMGLWLGNCADTKSEDNDDEENGDTVKKGMYFELYNANTVISPHK